MNTRFSRLQNESKRTGGSTGGRDPIALQRNIEELQSKLRRSVGYTELCTDAESGAMTARCAQLVPSIRAR